MIDKKNMRGLKETLPGLRSPDLLRVGAVATMLDAVPLSTHERGYGILGNANKPR